MQVWNLLHAVRWKHRTQKSSPKSPSGHHRTTLSGYIFATKARINNRKKNLLSSNISSTCPHNIVNFGPLAAEIGLPVWGTSSNFNGFRITARQSSSERQPNCGLQQRAPPMFVRATITLCIGPHSSCSWVFQASVCRDVYRWTYRSKACYWGRPTSPSTIDARSAFAEFFFSRK